MILSDSGYDIDSRPATNMYIYYTWYMPPYTPLRASESFTPQFYIDISNMEKFSPVLYCTVLYLPLLPGYFGRGGHGQERPHRLQGVLQPDVTRPGLVHTLSGILKYVDVC